MVQIMRYCIKQYKPANNCTLLINGDPGNKDQYVL